MTKRFNFSSLKLKPEEKAALLELKEALLERFKKRVETVVLFGSKAGGAALPSSDLDVLVLLDKEDLRSWEKIQGLSSNLSLKYNVFLSVKVMGHEHFDYLRSLQTGFITNVEKEGVEI
jgi:predicted nucleotidyltransferase